MPTERELRYALFNFLVDLGGSVSEGPHAGFQEVSGIDLNERDSNYRTGNSRLHVFRKVSGTAKVMEAILRRGVICPASLRSWLDDTRNGNRNARRTVTIWMHNEDHAATIMAWRLLNARIIKYAAGPLNAKGADVAMEEMVLGYERVEMD